MIFNVLGSCVSRDIFRFSKNHTVDINIQRNPISALKTQALKVDDSFLESAKLPNYEKRMLVSSVDRNCLKPIMESKAEWLKFVIEKLQLSQTFPLNATWLLNKRKFPNSFMK